MVRSFPTITALGAATVLLSVGGTLAQPRLDQTQLTATPASPAGDVLTTDGRVVEIERRPDMVTRLRLDNGASLQVARESVGPGEAPQVGDEVIARYEEVGRRDKVATHLKAIELQAP